MKSISAALQSVQNILELHSRQLGMKVEQGSHPFPADLTAYVEFRQLIQILLAAQIAQKLIAAEQGAQVLAGLR